jgi:hypothetical protein
LHYPLLATVNGVGTPPGAGGVHKESYRDRNQRGERRIGLASLPTEKGGSD